MKKLFFLLLLSLSGQLGFSQTCIPVEDAMWINNRSCHGEPPGIAPGTSHYWYYRTGSSDTIIRGESYYPFYVDYHKKNQFGWIRADSSKAYVLPGSDTVEYVLYDFSVEPGDTIHDVLIMNLLSSSGYQLLDFYHDTSVVHYCDTTCINMKPTIDTVSWANNQFWAYGVGNLNGFAELHPYSNINCNTSFICAAINDTSYYPPHNAGRLHCGYQNIALTESNTPTITIYPNPANISIQLDSQLKNHELLIYSITGQLIQQKKVDAESLSIQHLPSGIYVFQFVRDGQLVHQERISIQH